MAAGTAGKGRISMFLAVGPSGAGKDTLLLGAQQALSGRQQPAVADQTQPSVVFLKRHITRLPEKTTALEISCSAVEFDHIADTSGFGISWEAHGTKYGVLHSSLREALAGRGGRSVVLNVSRLVAEEVRERYQSDEVDVYRLHITAPIDVLRSRLSSRGREGSEEIEKRLARAQALRPTGDDVVTVTNSQSVEDGIDAIIQTLHGQRSYSVWLVPPEGSAYQAAAAATIAEVSSWHGRPPFPPHVTLGRPMTGHQRAALGAARAFAGGLACPPHIDHCPGLEVRKCSPPREGLEMPILTTSQHLEALRCLRDRAQENGCLPPDETSDWDLENLAWYHPHLSLLHGGDTSLSSLDRSVDRANVCVQKRQDVWRAGYTPEVAVMLTTGGAWERWNEVARFPCAAE